jgi:hypothetical protein
MLEGDVQIRQYLARGHELDDLIDMRIGVHIVQPDPDAQFAESRSEIVKASAARNTAPGLRGIFQIDAIGTGVLGNHQDFLHTGAHQLLRFAQHLTDRPADQVAAHGGNDAEAAAMIAALGDL